MYLLNQFPHLQNEEICLNQNCTESVTLSSHTQSRNWAWDFLWSGLCRVLSVRLWCTLSCSWDLWSERIEPSTLPSTYSIMKHQSAVHSNAGIIQNQVLWRSLTLELGISILDLNRLPVWETFVCYPLLLSFPSARFIIFSYLAWNNWNGC